MSSFTFTTDCFLQNSLYILVSVAPSIRLKSRFTSVGTRPAARTAMPKDVISRLISAVRDCRECCPRLWPILVSGR